MTDDSAAPNRRWWWPGSLPTTQAGALWGIALLVMGARVGTLVQMAPSFTSALRVAPDERAAAFTWLAALVMTVAVCVRMIATRGPLSTAWTAADLAVACVLLVLGPLTVPDDFRVGTWVGFQPGYALGVLLTASALRSHVLWLGAMTAVVASASVYMADGTRTHPSTVLGNLLTYIALGIVGRLLVGYNLRLAQDADRARALAAELGRREEEHRARVAIHNGAAVMRLLTDDDVDDSTRERLRQQALVESRRMRAYLQGPAPGASPAQGEVALAGRVQAVCERFVDLRLETSLDLGAQVRLAAEDTEAVEQALASVLLNVRQHAAASLVVVHLDSDEGDDDVHDGSAHGGEGTPLRWVLSVHDDGVGFDPQVTDMGVGLGDVVVGELASRGIGVDIDSEPGIGTTVRMGTMEIGVEQG